MLFSILPADFEGDKVTVISSKMCNFVILQGGNNNKVSSLIIKGNAYFQQLQQTGEGRLTNRDNRDGPDPGFRYRTAGNRQGMIK
jgi:hypothetical protein